MPAGDPDADARRGRGIARHRQVHGLREALEERDHAARRLAGVRAQGRDMRVAGLARRHRAAFRDVHSRDRPGCAVGVQERHRRHRGSRDRQPGHRLVGGERQLDHAYADRLGRRRRGLRERRGGRQPCQCGQAPGRPAGEVPLRRRRRFGSAKAGHPDPMCVVHVCAGNGRGRASPMSRTIAD